MPPKPEIKSPAGYWPQLHAAIEAGADAVYFGLTHFTARAKSGFALAELPEALRTLHARGVKGYVTFNTLIFDDELREAARALAAIAEAGADAILVQDWAGAALAREVAPGLPVHGSTQMSITDAAGVRHARGLGVTRLILARELSLEQIRAIRAETDGELEIFVHGALCVSYSGQCFSSEAWGGRSANRGQCAQACRLPYEMIVDGRVRPLGDARYLLSPGDLLSLRQIPEIVRIGLAALKIEGRHKDTNYVALATRAYREAVDAVYAGVTAPDRGRELEQVYSRGLGPWFLTGTDHQAVVRGRAPRHRGVAIGSVLRAAGSEVTIQPLPGAPPLKAGDGVVFDAAAWRSPQEPEEGGRVFAVTQISDGIALSFGNGSPDAARIRPGDLVWRTSDPDIAKAARPFTSAGAPLRKQRVDVGVVAREGQPLRLEWRLSGVNVTVTSQAPLGAAQSRALTRAFLRQQLGRLGGTPYELGELEVTLEGNPFAPASVLNRMRREAVNRLTALQSRPPRIEVRDPAAALARLSRVPEPAGPGEPQLHLLVRTSEQLDAALDLRPASITLDYLDLYGLRPSLERVKRSGLEPRVASPRVLKPGEERIARFLLRCETPLLIRSAGLLESLRGRACARLDGDFSLNAANAVSARLLLEQGLTRLAPTHDLNGAQVAQLARGTGARHIEAIAYHHLPVFHTEHCVFCRFLSSGRSYRDCGRPCENHRVALRDADGRAHPVMADAGCRNTVFGAEAQEASAHMEAWLAAGIRHFRLEFAHESAEQVRNVTEAFAAYVASRIPASQLKRRLMQSAPQGITEGSLLVPPGSAPLIVLR